MKTEIRHTVLVEHLEEDQIPPTTRTEIVYDGKVIGEVVGSENGPGVQIVSKHPMVPKWHADEVTKRVEIAIASEGPRREVEFPPKRG